MPPRKHEPSGIATLTPAWYAIPGREVREVPEEAAKGKQQVNVDPARAMHVSNEVGSPHMKAEGGHERPTPRQHMGCAGGSKGGWHI